MRYISRGLKLMAAAVLAICMALVVMQGLHGMNETVEAVSAERAGEPEMDQISAFKTLRQQVRAMEKAQLNDVAHSPDVSAELADMARRQLTELCEREEQELTIEGVLSMRGYDDPVVTVHADSVNVLIKTDMITKQQSSVIMELVCRETGVQSGNVKIIPIK